MLPIPFKIHFINELNSTNEYIKQCPLEHGLVIYAGYQSQGKGQANTTWESQAMQNLLCSILLEFSGVEVESQAYINMAISLALRQTVQILTQQPATIKWPNDIYCQHKKISGILIENSIQSNAIKQSIIGIGLNINQANFSQPNAISTLNIIGKELAISQVLHTLLAEINIAYQHIAQHNWEYILQQYNSHLFRKQETSYFSINNELVLGQIHSVNPNGLLAVLIGQQIHTFAHKEIAMII